MEIAIIFPHRGLLFDGQRVDDVFDDETDGFITPLALYVTEQLPSLQTIL